MAARRTELQTTVPAAAVRRASWNMFLHGFLTASSGEDIGGEMQRETKKSAEREREKERKDHA